MTPPTHTVYISAHYARERIGFLATVLDAILGWEGGRIEVNLVTNSESLERDETIQGFGERFRQAGSALRCVIAEDLEDPYHLPWYHKRFLAPWRESAGADDLFVYIEDDVVLSAEAIRYFRQYRPVLDRFGLVPGFIRFERRPDGEAVAVDLSRPEFYGHRNSVRVGEAMAHVCRNPYWAGYILDRELADQLIGSRSFDIEASRFVGWDVRARAAMGVCFERVPDGFLARNAVVLNDGRPDPRALVWHCANTYAAGDHSYYARVPLADAFTTGSGLAYQVDRIRARIGDLLNAPRLPADG